MKMKLEHYAEIKKVFESGKKQIEDHRVFLMSPDNPRKPKDLDARLQWDALNWFLGSQWICDELYPYLNDLHINSALRSVMAELFPPSGNQREQK